MDKYLLDIKNKEDFTAGSKARNDVENILTSLGFKRKFIYSKSNKKSVVNTVCSLLQIENQLKKVMRSLEENSILIVQYPWDFLMLKFSRIICNYANEKNIKTIVLIHDLNGLRTGSDITREYYKFIVCEYRFLNNFDIVIAHNETMKSILISKGVSSNKIKVIELFDYLINKKYALIQRNYNLPYKVVNIGGNLSESKAGYVYKLSDLGSLSYIYNLYGPNYHGFSSCFVKYRGVISSDELPKEINSGFGLVWDGDSLSTCNGNFGRYLKINNPHKLSMYIACGIPVIVWKDAALSDFVIKNHVGLCIKSLDELNVFFQSLSKEEYRQYCNNVNKIREKLINGYYLKKVISNIL